MKFLDTQILSEFLMLGEVECSCQALLTLVGLDEKVRSGSSGGEWCDMTNCGWLLSRKKSGILQGETVRNTSADFRTATLKCPPWTDNILRVKFRIASDASR